MWASYRSTGLSVSLSLSICGVELPTRSIRVQCPQYCGQVDSSSASTLVGYRWVSPSATHMSCSCSESRAGVGVRGPVGAPVGGDRDHVAADRVGVERVGPRVRRTDAGSGTIVLIICGGTSIDMVANRAWSAARSA